MDTKIDKIIAIMNEGKLEAIVWQDEKTHHQVFFSVDELGQDEINILLTQIYTKKVLYEQSGNSFKARKETNSMPEGIIGA